jgi:multidrug resistance efflux pump
MISQNGGNLTEGQATAPPTEPAAQRAIFASGILEGRQRDVALQFEMPGRLVSLEVKEGDSVRQGDRLACLDQANWLHELAKAEASLALAQAERERLVNGNRPEVREFAHAQLRLARARAVHASKRLDRGTHLRHGNALSQQDLDDLEGTAQATQAELEAAMARADEVEAPAREDELRMADAKIALEQARVQQARTALEKTELIAPSDGLILQVHTEPGEIVGPDSREPIITMVDVAELHVRAFVEELDALAIAPGQRAYVTADGMPGVKFWGSVAHCAPYMVPKRLLNHSPGERIDTKVREVLIALDPQDQLVIGLPVDVFVPLE